MSEGDKGGGAARACMDLIALKKRLRLAPVGTVMTEPRQHPGRPRARLAEAEKVAATEEKVNLTSRQRRARTVARLAAVQALYQMETGRGGGRGPSSPSSPTTASTADIEGEALAEADEAWFADIVRGRHRRARRAIDEIGQGVGWRRTGGGWSGMDATLRALLRSGRVGAESIRPEVPVKEIVPSTNMSRLAKAFFDDAEAKLRQRRPGRRGPRRPTQGLRPWPPSTVTARASRR